MSNVIDLSTKVTIKEEDYDFYLKHFNLWYYAEVEKRMNPANDN